MLYTQILSGSCLQWPMATYIDQDSGLTSNSPDTWKYPKNTLQCRLNTIGSTHWYKRYIPQYLGLIINITNSNSKQNGISFVIIAHHKSSAVCKVTKNISAEEKESCRWWSIHKFFFNSFVMAPAVSTWLHNRARGKSIRTWMSEPGEEKLVWPAQCPIFSAWPHSCCPGRMVKYYHKNMEALWTAFPKEMKLYYLLK